MKTNADNPRLTAYALGELRQGQDPDLDAAAREDPATAREICQIRDVAALLGAELQAEPGPGLGADRRQLIQRAARAEIARRRRFRRTTAQVSLAAAAMLVLAFVIRFATGTSRRPPAENRPEQEYALPPLGTTGWTGDGDAATMALLEREMDRQLAAHTTPGTADTAENAPGDRRTRPSAPTPEPMPFQTAAHHPRATFPLDIDSGSYADVRRFLSIGLLPPRGSVDVAELVNYFEYHMPPPEREHSVALAIEVAECPWQPAHRLVRLGLSGRRDAAGRRPPANLVFVVDVSGSMNAPDKLPLVTTGIRQLAGQLEERDRVAIVALGRTSRVVLATAKGNDRTAIERALDRLRPRGPSSRTTGIQTAYRLARQGFVEGGSNRIILATDGNIPGVTASGGPVPELVARNTAAGLFLSVVGCGAGNYQNAALTALADRGHGNYTYVGNVREAEKALAREVNATLVPVAEDVTVQVVFNPEQVGAYRLLGSRTPLVAAASHAGHGQKGTELGDGRTVTALYEIVPVAALPVSPAALIGVYHPIEPAAVAPPDGLLAVRVTYRLPGGDLPRIVQQTAVDQGKTYATASDDFKFAAAVAAFGMILGESPYRGQADLDAVLTLATQALGADPYGCRAEFLELARRSKAIKHRGTAYARPK